MPGLKAMMKAARPSPPNGSRSSGRGSTARYSIMPSATPSGTMKIATGSSRGLGRRPASSAASPTIRLATSAAMTIVIVVSAHQGMTWMPEQGLRQVVDAHQRHQPERPVDGALRAGRDVRAVEEHGDDQSAVHHQPDARVDRHGQD